MIPHGVEVFVALDPVGLRWSFDRLAGLCGDRLGREARSGALFVFFSKRRHALKVLFFDGTGMCLFYKLFAKRIDKCRERPYQRGRDRRCRRRRRARGRARGRAHRGA